MDASPSTQVNYRSLTEEVSRRIVGERRTVLEIDTRDTRGYVSLTPDNESIRVSSGLYQFYLSDTGIRTRDWQLSPGDGHELAARPQDLRVFLRILGEVTQQPVPATES